MFALAESGPTPAPGIDDLKAVTGKSKYRPVKSDSCQIIFLINTLCRVSEQTELSDGPISTQSSFAGEHFGRTPTWGLEQLEGCQPTTRRINRSSIRAGMAVFLVLFLCRAATGQTKQYWPEMNFYKRLTRTAASTSLFNEPGENGESTEVEVGGDLDFYLKPLVRLRDSGRQVDESRAQSILFRVGYHYLPSSGGSNEHRVIIEATPRIPLKAGAIISQKPRGSSIHQR
jgi:hypothetical protein